MKIYYFAQTRCFVEAFFNELDEGENLFFEIDL